MSSHSLCQMKYCAIINECDIINILNILYKETKDLIKLNDEDFNNCISLLNTNIEPNIHILKSRYTNYRNIIQQFITKLNIPLYHEFDINYYNNINDNIFNKWYIIPHIYNQVDKICNTMEEFKKSIEYEASIEYSHELYNDINISNILKRVNTNNLKCLDFFNSNKMDHISNSFSWRIFE